MAYIEDKRAIYTAHVGVCMWRNNSAHGRNGVSDTLDEHH